MDLFQQLRDYYHGYDIFVSYTWLDAGEFADALHQKLRALREDNYSISVFLDKADYSPGEDLERETIRRIQSSNFLLLLYSRRAPFRDWVVKEVRVAQEKGIPIIPVVINNIDRYTPSDNALLQLLFEKDKRYILGIDAACEESPDWKSLPSTISGPPSPKLTDEVPDNILDELQRGLSLTSVHRKRNRAIKRVVMGLTTLTVTAVILGTVAVFARQAAQRSADHAIEQRGIAISSTEKLIFQVQEKLEDRVGHLQLRRDILGEAVTLLDNILESMPESDSDPRVIRDRVVALARLVDIKVEQGDYESVADEARSLVMARESMLRQSDSPSLTMIRDTIAANARLADIERGLGQTDSALVLHSKNIDLSRELIERQSTLINNRQHEELKLASANLLRDSGRYQEALTLLEPAVQRLETLFMQQPANGKTLRALAHGYLILGGTYRALNQNQAALNAFQSGYSDADLYVTDHPDSLSGRIKLIELADELAKQYAFAGDLASARPFVTAAITHSQQLISLSPSFNAALIHSQILKNTIRFLHADGRPEEAAPYIDQALTLSRRIARTAPKSAHAISLAAGILNDAGGIVFVGGDPMNAIKYYEEAERMTAQYLIASSDYPPDTVHQWFNAACARAQVINPMQAAELTRQQLTLLINQSESFGLSITRPTSLPQQYPQCLSLLAGLLWDSEEIENAGQLYVDLIKVLESIEGVRALSTAHETLLQRARDKRRQIDE